MVTKMESQSALNNFLSLSLDELLEWINLSYQINLTSGFVSSTAKAMLEQEILYWIDENNQTEEVENQLFQYLDSLGEQTL